MPNFVIVERLEPDSDKLIAQFSRTFETTGLERDFNAARAIFIKPNLTYPYYKEGVTTRIEFVRALIAALRALNEKTIIYVGEGEGGYHSFSMSQAFIRMGFDKLERDFKHVKVINLSQMRTADAVLETSRGPYRIRLPEIFFREIDFAISCPVPKVHCMTGISLSYKNQWGCIPDVMRLKNHYMFSYIISRIGETLKFRYAFLDGRYALDNNGPMAGDPVEVNWFAASNSLGAFDAVVAGMMGVNWKKIKHLRVADKYGLVPDAAAIRVIGDVKSLRRKLALKRNFWNYPALFAFHSRALTHLFYFSRSAKLLHDIMYTFRKRPIE